MHTGSGISASPLVAICQSDLAGPSGDGKPFSSSSPSERSSRSVREPASIRTMSANQDLAAVGRRAEAGRLDHGRAEPVVVLEGGVARADPDAHREPVPVAELAVVAVDGPLHRGRAGERVGRARVRDHQRVADRLHLGAAGRGDRLAERGEVIAAQLVGGGVAQRGGQLGRADEIREQDRDQSGGAQGRNLLIRMRPSSTRPVSVARHPRKAPAKAATWVLDTPLARP